MTAAEERKTVLEPINAYSQGLGSGVTSNWKMITFAGGVTLIVAGCFGIKRSFGLSRFCKTRLGRPSFPGETSRITVGSVVKHPIKTIAQLIKRPEDLMKDIIVKPKLEEKLREIATVTRVTKENAGYFRNVLLYGPPGTGKSMFAERLAKHSGMHYTVLTGSDIAPMGKEGGTAVRKLFDRAEASRKGMLLFIDQADAFLRKRNTEVISENMRSAINTFLYRTGEQSNKFMVVLESNVPEQLDWSINDRLDEIVEFEIPSYEERVRLVRHYFQKFVLEPAVQKSCRFCVAEFDYEKKYTEIAEKTDGFSGREICKLGVAWQNKAPTSADGVLTEEMVDSVVKKAVQHHRLKVDWQHEASNPDTGNLMEILARNDDV